MTETTEENIKPRAGALGSTIEENMLPKIKSKLKKQAALITNLEAQVSSLTKEKVELKHDVEKRMHVADKIFKENRDLKSQLSNREKEIEELKQNVRNFINEGEGYCPDCLSKAFKSKGEAQ